MDMDEYDFSKELEIGRKVALRFDRKNQKLITFWIDEDLREKAYKKCPNLSSFLRKCVVKLVNSTLEESMSRTYTNAANASLKDMMDELEEKS
jgi:predicted DNA-binding ribbon-helix-helix protein